ncbi:MAG: bacteriocin [Streptococcaceae bacterium]|jgi:bacteriocin-like protein|nr:bacteriocin [Streptococcaceae bacterium]
MNTIMDFKELTDEELLQVQGGVSQYDAGRYTGWAIDVGLIGLIIFLG